MINITDSRYRPMQYILVKDNVIKVNPYAIYNTRNKDQKLVSCFSENRIFYRLLIAVPLKMYRKFG